MTNLAEIEGITLKSTCLNAPTRGLWVYLGRTRFANEHVVSEPRPRLTAISRGESQLGALKSWSAFGAGPMELLHLPVLTIGIPLSQIIPGGSLSMKSGHSKIGSKCIPPF